MMSVFKVYRAAICLVFGLGWAGGVSAQKTSGDFFDSLSTDWLRIDPPGSSSEGPVSSLREFVFDVLSQEPTLRAPSLSATCQMEGLEQSLESAHSSEDQAQALQSYLVRCRDEVETGVKGRWENSFEIFRWRYPSRDHPFMRRVRFNLPAGGELRGLLALKGDRQARPLVVLRLGILGNIEESYAESFILRQLFEQGPFNVLVVESSTSRRYLEGASWKGYGGYIEGPQNLQLAQHLRQPQEPISKLISSLHFVGMSLGGHGLLQAAMEEPQQGAQVLYESYLGICPLIDFAGTTASALAPGWKGSLFDLWLWYRTGSLGTRTLGEGFYWKGTWWKGQPSFWPQMLEVARNQGPLPEDFYQGITWSQKGLNFAKGNNLPSGLTPRSPVLLLATEDDDLVPPSLNVQAFFREKQMRASSADIGVMLFSRGYHCTLPVAYHWDFVSAVLNTSLLAWTKKQFTEEVRTMELVPQISTSVSLRRDLEWPSGQDHPQVVFTSENSQSGVRSWSMDIPVEDLDFGWSLSRATEPEKKVILAWLERNLRHQMIEEKNRSVLKIFWRRWSDRR